MFAIGKNTGSYRPTSEYIYIRNAPNKSLRFFTKKFIAARRFYKKKSLCLLRPEGLYLLISSFLYHTKKVFLSKKNEFGQRNTLELVLGLTNTLLNDQNK